MTWSLDAFIGKNNLDHQQPKMNQQYSVMENDFTSMEIGRNCV